MGLTEHHYTQCSVFFCKCHCCSAHCYSSTNLCTRSDVCTIVHALLYCGMMPLVLCLLCALLELRGIFQHKEGVFYDLGCGTGKPVFAAAAVHPWKRCIGMEILSDLHGICQNAFQVCAAGCFSSGCCDTGPRPPKGTIACHNFLCVLTPDSLRSLCHIRTWSFLRYRIHRSAGLFFSQFILHQDSPTPSLSFGTDRSLLWYRCKCIPVV